MNGVEPVMHQDAPAAAGGWRRRRRTTLACLVALVAAGCSCSPEAAAPPPGTPPPDTGTSAPPTTAPVPLAAWPLTGKLAAMGTNGQPALAVKVDNSPQARPHAALNDADLVYELQVESITRFMEVFHSVLPERVGPVRSARSSDMDLLAGLGRPSFAWSGANPGVAGQVRAAAEAGALVDVGANSDLQGEYYRDRSRGAPHNLYTNGGALHDRSLPPDGTGGPHEVFNFRPPEAPPVGGTPAPGVHIDFGGGVVVDYVWDEERKGWDRFQVDQLHGRERSAFVDEGGRQVAPDNVVVLFLDYSPDPVDGRSPLAHSVGEGDGLVLSGGVSIPVHWSRAGSIYGWTLTSATGERVELTRGRTWVALPPAGQGGAGVLEGADAAALLAFRA
jgi:hypothetical protein